MDGKMGPEGEERSTVDGRSTDMGGMVSRQASPVVCIMVVIYTAMVLLSITGAPSFTLTCRGQHGGS